MRTRAAAAMAMAPTTLGLPGLFAIGQSGPVDFVRRDDLHRSSARVLRCTVEEHVLRANQRSGAERRVHLVSREDHEVEVFGIVVWLDVDAAMRRQLRGIDKNAGADAREPFAPAGGWAARSRSRSTPRSRSRAPRDRRKSRAAGPDRPRRAARRWSHARPHDSRAPSPGQVVRVVLHQGRENDGILPAADSGRTAC